MTARLQEIQISSEFAAPAAKPMALAFENGNLWVGSAKDWTVNGVRLADRTVFASAKAPEKPFGSVIVGQTLRIIVGDASDNRTIRSYELGQDFTGEVLRCPRDTGNFLAYDGSALYVSQRYDKLLVKLDALGNSASTAHMPREVVGIAYVVNGFFILTTDGSLDDDDIRFARLDLSGTDPSITELARVPFGARALAFDGTRFWTSWRDNDTIVSFEAP